LNTQMSTVIKRPYNSVSSQQMSVHIREIEETVKSAKWLASVLVSWSTDSTFMIEISNLADHDEEKIMAWFLEDYAFKDPFNAGKATKARTIMGRYGQALYQLLFAKTPIPSTCTSLLIFVESTQPDSHFQRLHWELVEGCIKYKS